MTKFFGGKPKADPAVQARAAAAAKLQAEQAAELKKRNAEAEAEAASRKRVLGAAGGKFRSKTLTGLESGLRNKLG